MANKNTYATRAAGPKGRQAAPALEPEPADNKPLLCNNFVWVAIACALVIIGFALMAGKPSGVDAFNPDIFSTRRIVVGPLLSFAGFVLMAVAIIVKPKGCAKKQAEPGAQTNS